MLKRELVETIFKAFSIERWNDKLRPMELNQMDRHSHKMMIAFCFAKYEEDAGNPVNWLEIIRGGIYELLRRTVISDIQSPVYKEIAKNEVLLKKLNEKIYSEIESFFPSNKIRKEFHDYMFVPGYISPQSQEILNAAGKYASYWEFKIIQTVNPTGWTIEKISLYLGKELEKYNHLIGMKKINTELPIKRFLDLCGELRYQIRWGHLPRIPKTSVLGHVMLVATLTYFVSNELKNPCDKRIYNNFFGALFHDLPEAITRDIIKPIKRSVEGMQEEIKKIEDRLTDQEIFPLVEAEWIEELKFFTRDEFDSKIRLGEKVKDMELNTKYNDDIHNPYDGELIKSIDDFAAFLEALNSIDYGIKSKELETAKTSIRELYAGKVISGLPVYKLFENFN